MSQQIKCPWCAAPCNFRDVTTHYPRVAKAVGHAMLSVRCKDCHSSTAVHYTSPEKLAAALI